MKLARYLFACVLLAAPIAFAQASGPTKDSAAIPMKTWFIRLIPPRATFGTDMTEAEGELMQKHFVFWKQQYAKGVLVFGGPVFDPKGVYGVIVLHAPTEDEARSIASADPSVVGGLNKIDVAEMKESFPPPKE